MQRAVTFGAGVALGSALTYLLSRSFWKSRARKAVAYQRTELSTAEERSSWRPVGEKPVLGSRHMLRRLRRRDQKIDSEGGVYYNSADAPDWCQGLFSDSSQRRVLLREWEDAEWRVKAGWVGSDLIHRPGGRGVQVLAYFWHPESLTLTGIARFGPDAESHRGLCHGGAMTSLMDDLCGHICFVAAEAPWCGATVQVNCKLMKPVHVSDASYKVVGRITKRERSGRGETTKVTISAELLGEDDSVYARLEGLSVTPVRMAASDALAKDAVAQRKWLGGEGEALCDSGWLL